MAEDMIERGPRMTCVFAFNVRSYPSSPFEAETPFGRPITVAADDACARADELEAALELFLIACSHTTYPHGHPIWTAFAAAEKALGITSTTAQGAPND